MTNGMVTHAQGVQGGRSVVPQPVWKSSLTKTSLPKRVLMQALVQRFGAAMRAGKSSLTSLTLFALAYFVSALRYLPRLLQGARLKCVITRRDPSASVNARRRIFAPALSISRLLARRIVFILIFSLSQ